MDLIKLAEEIINGRRLSAADDLSFFETCSLQELSSGADKIRKEFRSDRVDLCSIINGRGGKCGENCKFCAQSAFNHTDCNTFPFISTASILSAAKENASEGIHRFSIVTAGKSLSGKDFEKALEAYRILSKEVKISLCASMGFLTSSQFSELKASGVSRYHCNIETSRKNFPNICTSHTFEMKEENIKRAKEAGLEVCSGGIIGMGETFHDRIDMALDLSQMKVSSIPLNVLMPIPGTPFENLPPLSEDEIIRTIAMFRYINPEAGIRLAAGRKLYDGKRAFCSGADSTITGNMLTTTGTTVQGDRKLLESLGRSI